MGSSSNARTNVTGEASSSSSPSNYPTKTKRSRHDSKDSNGSNYPSSQAKRLRHESNISASKLKGVVCQLNGHWGAQIYANHQRIWLGTFKSEKEAAMAYDSAAIKLRDGDCVRNFPWSSITAQEPNFQSQFSAEAVVNMIKDGSYASKFAEYLNVNLQIQGFGFGRDSVVGPGKEAYSCRKLFRKELTPSDVGKLNRLVIPKKNALKYFPHASEGVVERGGQIDDVQLVFYDKSMRLWEFRYCYWKSSRSYVFTRGWNKFVKAKGLKAKDTIVFSLCRHIESDGVNDVLSFNLIDVSLYDGLENNPESARGSGGYEENVEQEFEEQARLPEPRRSDDVTEEHKEPDQVKESVGVYSVSSPSKKKGFRLFGIQII